MGKLDNGTVKYRIYIRTPPQMGRFRLCTTEEGNMSPKRELTLSEWFGKKSWVPCRLQSMAPNQFITTVNRILRGQQRIESYDRSIDTKVQPADEPGSII